MRRIPNFIALSLMLWIGCISLFFRVSEVGSAEMLTVTKDQAELRSAPRTKSKVLTLILRNTRVEWTGNQQGSWLEVKLPNGLQGWVLASFVSAPKSMTKPTPAVTQPPQESIAAPETFAQTQPPSSDISETLRQKDEEIAQLRQLLADQEAEVESKTDRIAQLTEEINILQAQVAQLSQTGESTDGPLEEEKNKVKNLEYQLSQLHKILSEKDQEIQTLSAQNVSLKQQLALSGKSGINWPIYLVPILLILLVALAIYAFRDHLPLNLARRWTGSSGRFEVEPEEQEPVEPLRTASSGEIRVGTENSSRKGKAPASKTPEEGNRVDKSVTVKAEEAARAFPEKDKEYHTRRIALDSEAPIDYRSGEGTLQDQTLGLPKSELEEHHALSEERFDIYLTKVGDKREKVLQMLSKVKGLVRSPEELLSSVPCTIARNVEKSNAEKFRHYMNRVGATIELIKSED